MLLLLEKGYRTHDGGALTSTRPGQTYHHITGFRPAASHTVQCRARGGGNTAPQVVGRLQVPWKAVDGLPGLGSIQDNLDESGIIKLTAISKRQNICLFVCRSKDRHPPRPARESCLQNKDELPVETSVEGSTKAPRSSMEQMSVQGKAANQAAVRLDGSAEPSVAPGGQEDIQGCCWVQHINPPLSCSPALCP